jgi:hypothetical protein
MGEAIQRQPVKYVENVLRLVKIGFVSEHTGGLVLSMARAEFRC